MSYILDALRRADAERERGAVPGIHAQPVPMIAPEGSMNERTPPWRWIATGVGLALLLPLAWQWMWRADAPVARSPGAQLPTAAAPAPTPQLAQSRPVAPPAASTTAVMPKADLAAASSVATTAAGTATRAVPGAPAPTPPKSAAAVARVTPPADARPSQAGNAKPPAAASEQSRVLAYNELPDDIRRQLPKLVFGGSVHSDQAADRILIVNSQLLREGETVAPGVVLEQIKRQSAVFKFNGYRYEMTY